MNRRVQVYYSGQVQGVGFRFSIRAMAQQLGLTGWVKNLADGTVEFLCEGKEEALNKLLEQIEGEFSGYIHGKRINWMQFRGEFHNFEIRFF